MVVVILDGTECSVSRYGGFIHGKMAHGTRWSRGFVNFRASVEAIDTRISSRVCWEPNLNTSLRPVAVRVSRVMVMVGNGELASDVMLNLRNWGNLCPCLKALRPITDPWSSTIRS